MISEDENFQSAGAGAWLRILQNGKKLITLLDRNVSGGGDQGKPLVRRVETTSEKESKRKGARPAHEENLLSQWKLWPHHPEFSPKVDQNGTRFDALMGGDFERKKEAPYLNATGRGVVRQYAATRPLKWRLKTLQAFQESRNLVVVKKKERTWLLLSTHRSRIGRFFTTSRSDHCFLFSFLLKSAPKTSHNPRFNIRPICQDGPTRIVVVEATVVQW